jgi:DNA-binding HxlR family transcriptional regulator
MAEYGQFCPVALGAEIFAERWTPLILREMLAGGRRFSDIHRGVPRMSRNLLAQRLVSLEQRGIIDKRAVRGRRGSEYQLTEAGRALGTVVDALGTWGYRWASQDLTEEHLDPDFLMWALRRMVRGDQVPAKRMVALFRFRREAKRQYWLVLKQPDVDLCLLDPGFDVDVEVHAETEVLARVCLGQLPLLEAVKAGGIELTGAPRHRRALCECLGVTRFARTPAA